MKAREIRHGELVGGLYELEESVGKGGMAEVWRAIDRQTGQRVAVKFLRPAEELLRQFDTRDRQDEVDVMLRRFKQEAKLLDSFNSHGIPRLYGDGSHRGIPYLVMEFVDGQALNDFLALRRPLTLEPSVAIAVQIADALTCAHSLPVVHRDLKPQNVMLSKAGVVKLVDFGIAKDLGLGAASYTRHGSTLGSLGYQAPEQILGDPVTPKTDVYSFGCVCYEMFAGRVPFVDSEAQGLQGQHLKVTPLPLVVFAPQVPSDLEGLVLRMLDKDPTVRPDMEEISATFRQHLPPPGAPAPLPRLDPDPTLPFRQPAGDADERSTDGAGPAPMRHEPSSDWLTVRGVEADCHEAEQELASGAPGPAIARLAGLAKDARREWGSARPLVRKVGRLAAEGLRIFGDHGRAAPLYQQLSDDLARSRDPQDHATALVWRLRAAECRLSFGDSTLALETLHEAATAAASTLPETSAKEVRSICRELETRLNELGYRPHVQRLLERLERELG